MKQSQLSIKIIKGLLLVIGLFLTINSGVLDELSSQNPSSIKFFSGMLFILIASMKRIRQTIRETF